MAPHTYEVSWFKVLLSHESALLDEIDILTSKSKTKPKPKTKSKSFTRRDGKNPGHRFLRIAFPFEDEDEDENERMKLYRFS